MADLELTHIRRRWTNGTTGNAPIAAIPLAISRFFSVAFGFAPHVIPRLATTSAPDHNQDWPLAMNIALERLPCRRADPTAPGLADECASGPRL